MTIHSVPRRLGAFAGLMVLLVVLDWSAIRYRHQVDLTADQTQTLTRETVTVVRALRHRVRATAFFGPSDPSRVSAPTLLARYGRLNRRITYRVVDTDKAPAAAREAGIDPAFGGIALNDGTRVEQASTATEQDITAALARLERGTPRRLCVAAGHGEPDLQSTADDGMATTAQLLTRNGYVLREVDLLASPEVSAACDVALLAAPTAELGPAGAALQSYLAGGGRAVILTDPAANVDLRALLEPYGVSVERGIVFEGDANSRFPDDPTRPIVRRYRSASSVVRRLAPTFYPGVQAVIPATSPPAGVAVDVLAGTSGDSYLEHDPVEPHFDESTDRPGPIAVVVAADSSANEGGRVRRTRIVVAGDVDFATNAFVEQGGNGELLVRALDWVTLDESLVTVSANLPRTRPLDLTEGRINYARFLLAGAIPLLFLLAGAMVFAVQRAR